ncbi:MAG: class C sortase [Lachnospiraceae bacterium]|jgi:sortase A|nr:class C sortase [Lachnospiraceae bacterium]
MKKKITTISVFILFLAGLSLLLYPFLSNQWNQYRQSKLITTYEEAVTELAAADRIDYEKEWERAFTYNDALIPYILPDSFAAAEAQLPEGGDQAYLASLNLTGDGMMGFVEIPKINVKLPIFHTTEEEVLQKGAGHLAGSSLPVGGEGTHAVISAHRGLPSAALFTDLDQLEEGDYFFLAILDDTLCYQVDQISVVEPSDTSRLESQEGKDLVTLLTCTPYGVNSHRLLVQGHRVAYQEIEEDHSLSLLVGPSLHTSYLLWVIVGLAVTGGFILILYLLDRKWKRKQGMVPKDAQ